jgi:hypothetical protein
MRRSYLFLLLMLIAEIASSFAVWHGVPTDWRGKWPDFWPFEILRLKYWFGFCLLFAGVWTAIWMSFGHWLTKLTLSVVGVACSLAIELLTSIYFWRTLRSDQVGYLGWPSERRYAVEHLTSWVFVVLFGLVIFYFWDRPRKSAAQVAQ